jgi:RNA polymerase sigma factor (sigma-70 family)
VAAARTSGRPVRADAGASARRAEAMVSRHGAALLRVANQFSLCHDDALDAYQRALEIYLRRIDTVEPATEGAWMRVVVKHEAMAIRRGRQECVEREAPDFDASVPAGLRDVEDEVAGGERVGRSVEALRALKPDEARALMLKAQGLSYQEIGRRFGWSYTKVNRSVTEGRAHFLRAYRGIEAGEACERYAETLTALAAGTATSVQIVAIRPHLRHCAPCRAAVRELRLTRRRRIAMLLPGLPWLHERRLEVSGLFTRAANSDVGAGVQYASASGGGRLGPAAALAGLCLGGVGAAGAVCMVSGASPVPPPLVAHAATGTAPERAQRHVVARRRHAVTTPAPLPVTPPATPTPVPARTPSATPPPRRPVAHHARAKTAASGEFGFEAKGAAGGGGSSHPPTATAASAGGGGSGSHAATPHAAGAASKPAGEFDFEGG